MASHSKGAASPKEVEAWLGRIDEITGAISDYIQADPDVEARRVAERTDARAKAAEEERQRRVREHYTLGKYKRYEDDAWIDGLLAAVDTPPEPLHKRLTDLTDFERVALREAEARKTEGNAAMGRRDYAAAHAAYSQAVGMGPADDDLLIALHNNRAQAALAIDDAQGALADATYVLTRQRHNAKALLRRATALARLQRPADAMQDVRRLLIAEPGNAEAKRLEVSLEGAVGEAAAAEAFRVESPEEFQRLQASCAGLCASVPAVAQLLLSAPPAGPAADALDAALGPALPPLAAIGAVLQAHPQAAMWARALRGLDAAIDLLTLLTARTSSCPTTAEGQAVPMDIVAQPAVVVTLATVLRTLVAAYPTAAARGFLPAQFKTADARPLLLASRGALSGTCEHGVSAEQAEALRPLQVMPALAVQACVRCLADPSVFLPLREGAARWLTVVATVPSLLPCVWTGTDQVHTGVPTSTGGGSGLSPAQLADVLRAVSESFSEEMRKGPLATAAPVHAPLLTATLTLTHRLLQAGGGAAAVAAALVPAALTVIETIPSRSKANENKQVAAVLLRAEEAALEALLLVPADAYAAPLPAGTNALSDASSALVSSTTKAPPSLLSVLRALDTSVVAPLVRRLVSGAAVTGQASFRAEASFVLAFNGLLSLPAERPAGAATDAPSPRARLALQLRQETGLWAAARQLLAYVAVTESTAAAAASGPLLPPTVIEHLNVFARALGFFERCRASTSQPFPEDAPPATSDRAVLDGVWALLCGVVSAPKLPAGDADATATAAHAAFAVEQATVLLGKWYAAGAQGGPAAAPATPSLAEEFARADSISPQRLRTLLTLLKYEARPTVSTSAPTSAVLVVNNAAMLLSTVGGGCRVGGGGRCPTVAHVLAEANAARTALETIRTLRTAAEEAEREISRISGSGTGTTKAPAPAGTGSDVAAQAHLRGFLRAAQKNVSMLLARWLTSMSGDKRTEGIAVPAAAFEAQFRELNGFQILAVCGKETGAI